MMDLVAPLVAPALSQKPAFVTYFVARGAPRPCYIPEGFDSLPFSSLKHPNPARGDSTEAPTKHQEPALTSWHISRSTLVSRTIALPFKFDSLHFLCPVLSCVSQAAQAAARGKIPHSAHGGNCQKTGPALHPPCACNSPAVAGGEPHGAAQGSAPQPARAGSTLAMFLVYTEFSDCKKVR